MKRLLGSLLLVTLLLAGCGDDGDEPEGSGDAESSSQSPTDSTVPTENSTEPSESTDEPTPDDGHVDPEWSLVEIVHATAVGGDISPTPTPIPDGPAIADFSSQFESPELRQEIGRVARSNAPLAGYELMAAVVAIGCDVPPGVTYVDGEVHPKKVPNPLPECFAPVTSVAILVVQA